ncbi:MAG: hypothetical protein ACMUIP_11875, partial [bacterium]
VEEGMDLYRKLLNDEKLKLKDRITIADELNNQCGKTEFAEKILLNTLKKIDNNNYNNKYFMEIHFRLTQLYIHKGELNKAKAHWEKAKNTNNKIPGEYFSSIGKYLQNN